MSLWGTHWSISIVSKITYNSCRFLTLSWWWLEDDSIPRFRTPHGKFLLFELRYLLLYTHSITLSLLLSSQERLIQGFVLKFFSLKGWANDAMNLKSSLWVQSLLILLLCLGTTVLINKCSIPNNLGLGYLLLLPLFQIEDFLVLDVRGTSQVYYDWTLGDFIVLNHLNLCWCGLSWLRISCILRFLSTVGITIRVVFSWCIGWSLNRLLWTSLTLIGRILDIDLFLNLSLFLLNQLIIEEEKLFRV